MLRTQDLLEWFEGQAASLSPGVSFSMDTLPQPTPHRVCVIRITGGLGLEAEDALDRPTFQLLTRGVNGRDAERIALALDAIWIDGPPSFYVGDYRIVGKGRFGGPPAFVGEDQNEVPEEDPSSRVRPPRILRSATYWCRIEYNASGGG